MKLGSEIRSRMLIGVVCGFLIGMSFYVVEVLSWFDTPEGAAVVIGSAVFLLAIPTFQVASDEIPRIVAEAERELTKAEDHVQTGMFFCRYCGAENKKEAVFCKSCGKKLN